MMEKKQIAKSALPTSLQDNETYSSCLSYSLLFIILLHQSKLWSPATTPGYARNATGIPLPVSGEELGWVSICLSGSPSKLEGVAEQSEDGGV